ncbi:MAG: ORF6N domain-containing protein [Planctomycetota bacterium]
MQTLSIKIDQKLYPVLNLPDRPKALLDRTVADIYGILTKQINQAVSRNPQRFPDDFCFELTLEEIRSLSEVTNCDFVWKGGHLPKAFTWEGCNMLATVLKSEIAIKHSLQIIRAFTAIERNRELASDLAPQLRFGDREILKSLAGELNQIHLEMRDLKERMKNVETQLSKASQSQETKYLGVSQTKQLYPIDVDGLISKHQGQQLQNLVKTKAKSKKQMLQIWFQFKKRFEVSRYVHLPKEKFNEALKWLKKLD